MCSNPYTYQFPDHISFPSITLKAISRINMATVPVSLLVLRIFSNCGSLLPHPFARKHRTGCYWPATNGKIKNLSAKWAQLHQLLLSCMQTCQIIAVSLRLNWDASEPLSKAQLRSHFFPLNEFLFNHQLKLIYTKQRTLHKQNHPVEE